MRDPARIRPARSNSPTPIVLAALLVAALVLPGGGLVLHASAAPPKPQAEENVGPLLPKSIDGRVDDWVGESTRVGGTWRLSRGELVYQDHLFDDLGAATSMRAQQHATVQNPSGRYRYPSDEDRYGHNAADLLELRLAADATHLYVLARMNTLKVPDSTVVALAFDVDGDDATGGGNWPHAAGIAVPGADRVLTLWGTGGTLTDLTASAGSPAARPAPLPAGDVAVDTDNAHNAIEARVSLAALGASGGLRVWAATGLWDASAAIPGDPATPGEWMAIASQPSATQPGGGSPLVPARVFNVAFRSHDTGSYFEERQAAALAAGDISSFSATVDLPDLRSGRSEPWELEPGRFYAVIVDTGLEIPPLYEGVSYAGVPGRFGGLGGAALSQNYSFLGRFQPYGLYVPTTHDGTTPQPAALVLHGLGGSHSSFNSRPGFLRDMGEGGGTGRPPLYLITPLARGSSFYADWGEADTLAALDDAFARVPVDSDRLYLTGYSMGGYGVYRLASLYPDRFAAAASWAGYSGEVVGHYLTEPVTSQGSNPNQGRANIGAPVQTMENLRHLPLVLLSGTNDQIVPTTGQYAIPRRLAELGYRSRWDVYGGYEHFAFGLVDEWRQVREWLGDRRREVAPRQVTYRFSDGWTEAGLAERLGLVHGNAWWLRDLTMRHPTDDAFVIVTADATSHGRSAPVVVAGTATRPATNPHPHVQHEVTWTEVGAHPIANRLDLRLDGVGTATVDLDGAGLTPCGLVLDVATDGPVTIRLAGSAHGSARLAGLPGATATRDGRTGHLSVTVGGPLAAGSVGTITCAPGVSTG